MTARSISAGSDLRCYLWSCEDGPGERPTRLPVCQRAYEEPVSHLIRPTGEQRAFLRTHGGDGQAGLLRLLNNSFSVCDARGAEEEKSTWHSFDCQLD